MTTLIDEDHDAYGRILLSGLQDAVDEIHAIDLIDLMTHIRSSEYAAIEDLVSSSTELFFREGSLTFAWSASASMERGGIPTVTLGMEFTHLSVSVFFDLLLQATDQAVTVGGILFDPACHDREEKLKRLSRAVADAKLPRQPRLGGLRWTPRA